MDTTAPTTNTTIPEKDSRWVVAGNTHPFTVLHVGEDKAFVRGESGTECAVQLFDFANGRYVPAPEPLPEPPTDVWFTVDDEGTRRGWHHTEGEARRWAPICRRPAIARYTLAEVKRVDGAK